VLTTSQKRLKALGEQVSDADDEDDVGSVEDEKEE
jgi:hypothetical protein